MARVNVITGSASGIGRATRELLESRGDQVIGIDLHDAEVIADLSSPEGRAEIADQVAAQCYGSIDSIIAVAGVMEQSALAVRVNYFGAISSLETLRPMLRESTTPRAALVASFSAVLGGDRDLIQALRAGDEETAAARADEIASNGRGHLVYRSTKQAIAEWVREYAVTAGWAGAGIPLNAVAPGIVLTPMTRPVLETEEGHAHLHSLVPMSLHGAAEPVVIARSLAWLTSPENTHITGQVVFVDGGAEANHRGPRVF